MKRGNKFYCGNVQTGHQDQHDKSTKDRKTKSSQPNQFDKKTKKYTHRLNGNKNRNQINTK